MEDNKTNYLEVPEKEIKKLDNKQTENDIKHRSFINQDRWYKNITLSVHQMDIIIACIVAAIIIALIIGLVIR